MPKISIVLPTYNGEKYIRESIDSVLRQTIKDWELIIVNDCSNDGTQAIIDEYARKDARIKVINNKINRKLPAALNIGFSKATGKYLTWTSDDNFYYDNALEKLSDFLDENQDSYMVCSDMQWINEQGMDLKLDTIYDNQRIIYNDCVGASFMYRREILNELGGYDEAFFLVEDYEYWFRIRLKYGRIDYINEKLYCYRLHANSLTETRSKAIHAKLLDMREKYFDDIIDNIKDDKKYLCAIYYDFKMHGRLTKYYSDKLIDLVPEVAVDNEEEYQDTVIVYGAGNYGNKLFAVLGDRIKYYADQNPEKVGQRLNGISIISLSEMKQKTENYQIVVAASLENLYSFLETIKKLEIAKIRIATEIMRGYG